MGPIVSSEPHRVHFIGAGPAFAFELGTVVHDGVDGRSELRRCAQWTKGGEDDQGGDGKWRMCFCMLYDEAAARDSGEDEGASSSGYSSDDDMERGGGRIAVTFSDEDLEPEYPSFDSGSDFDPVVTWEYSDGRMGSPPSGSFTDSASAGYGVQGSEWHTWHRAADTTRQRSPRPAPPVPRVPESPFGPAEQKWELPSDE